MKKTTTKVLACLAGLFLLGAGNVWAADSDTASLTIIIQPSVDYGVKLTGGSMEGGGGSLTTIAGLETSVYMSDPAVMEILGNFDNQEVSVTAAGLDSWGIDENDADEEADMVQVYAVFSDIVQAARPLTAHFEQGTNDHLVFTTAKWAGDTGENGGTDSQFETEAVTDPIDMDNMVVGAKRNLWIRLDTPPDTTSSEEQRIQVTVTANSGMVY